jgi:DNA-directed RNA polymerases I, II, and III subunit RPABC2
MSTKVKSNQPITNLTKNVKKAGVSGKKVSKDSQIETEIKNDIAISKNIKDTSNQLFSNQINSRVLSTYETDHRDIMTKYNVSKNITRPKMTQYEKALVLGKRATQISSGAKPNITVKVGMTVVEIATEELRQKKVPFIIKRPIGNKFEYWKIKDLIVNLD